MEIAKAILVALLLCLSQFANAFGVVYKDSQTSYCPNLLYPPDKSCAGSPEAAYARMFYQIHGSSLGAPLTDSIGNLIGSMGVSGGPICQTDRNTVYCYGFTVYYVIRGIWTPAFGLGLELTPRVQQLACPSDSTEDPAPGSSICYCDKGFHPAMRAGKSFCAPYVSDFMDAPQSCPANPGFGKPILPLSGSEKFSVDLGVFLGQRLALTYDSRHAAATIIAPEMREVSTAFDYLPQYWGLTLFKALFVQEDLRNLNANMRVHAIRGPGAIHTFRSGSTINVFTPTADLNDRLVLDSGKWIYYDEASKSVEKYSYAGVLQSISFADGRTLQYVYSDATTDPAVAPRAGLPIRISDGSGRSIAVGYTLLDGRPTIVRLSYSDGTDISFGYDGSGNVEYLFWPGSAYQKFLYENPSFPWAVTGIEDEDRSRWATISYDQSGRAIETKLAGDVNRYVANWGTPPKLEQTASLDPTFQTIDKYLYTWVSPQNVSVTMPNGVSSSVEAKPVLGVPRLTAQSQPAGSGCAAATSSQDFDANGNISWKEDFRGYRTCFANDLTRNLETARVEGLAAGSSCSSVLPVDAVLPASARKVTTSWHPQWRVETRKAEPGRITTYVYNGQPDPTSPGGPVLRCAPTDAVLADGSPIVVLCKQIEQATSDASGARGFAATADSSAPARVQQWTYDRFGRVLTATDPLNNTTTNAYYVDTTSDHTEGDLYTVTNAKNHVVTYTRYNAAGQWLEMKDANDVMTTRTFDSRQRVKTVKTGTSQTSYDYWPTGLLKQVTLPDNSSVSYVYDAAHRLTSITDNLGNSVTYGLDTSGNRISEEVKDAGGNLAKTLSRIPDALNRIQQVAGRP